MADDLNGNNDAAQLISKMASWPKWATDDSINRLTNTIASNNTMISGLIKQISSEEKPAAATKVSSGTTNIDYSKPIITEFQRGINKLDSRLGLTNILLNEIKNSGKRSSINRPRDSRGRYAPGPAQPTPTADHHISDAAKLGAESINSAVHGFVSAFNEAIKHINESTKHIKTEGNEVQHKGITREVEHATAALEDAKKQQSSAGWGKIKSSIDAVVKAEQDLAETLIRYEEKVGEKYKPKTPTSDANKGAGNFNIGGVGSQILSGKNSWSGTISSVTGALGQTALSLSKFNPLVVGLVTAFELLIPVAGELLDIWKKGAENSSKALDKGLMGLTKTALSATILPKEAGLSMETWNKLIAKSNGGLAQMDSNMDNAGLTFATGTKEFLDLSRKSNYFGTTVDELADDFLRASDLVGRSGLKDQKARSAALDMAQDDASTIWKLSVQTGQSMTGLRKKFDDLNQNDSFRAAYTKLLASGEKDAAKNLKEFSETLIASKNAFGKGLAEDLSDAIITGMDPTLFSEKWQKASVYVEELTDSLRKTQGMSVAKRNADLSSAAQSIQNDQPRMALLRQTQPEIYRYVLELSQNRKETTKTDFPDTPGAKQAAVSEDLKRATEKASGEILKAVEPLMPAFTALAKATYDVVDAFTKLPTPIKTLIEIIGAAALLFGAKKTIGGLRRLGGRILGVNTAEAATTKTATSAAKGVVEKSATEAAATEAKAATKAATNGVVEGATKAATNGVVEGAATSGLSETVKKSPIRSLYDKVFNSGKYAPVDVVAEKNAAEAAKAAKAAPVNAAAEAPKAAPVNAAASAAEGATATSGLKDIAKKTLKLGGGGAVGALLDTAINELTEIPELKALREEILDKYKKGEIVKDDAIKAIKDIDDKIAESRGGAATRGAVVGTGAMIGEGLGAAGGAALGGAIGTAIAPGAGTVAGAGYGGTTGAISGAIGGGMLTDKLLGGISESIGGWISKKLFGGDESSIGKELDEVKPGEVKDKKAEPVDAKDKVGQTDVANGVINVANGDINFAKSGPQAQPGVVPSTAAQPDIGLGNINPAKLASGPQAQPGVVPSTAATNNDNVTSTSTDSAEIYKALLLQSAFPNDLSEQLDLKRESEMTAKANMLKAATGISGPGKVSGTFQGGKITSATGSVATPTSLTGGGLPPDPISKNAQDTGAKITTSTTTGNAFNSEAVGTTQDQMIRLQKQANEILMAIANAASAMSNSTYKTADLLENINNKT